MYKRTKHCQLLLKLAVSSSPSQLLVYESQTAVATALDVLSNLWRCKTLRLEKHAPKESNQSRQGHRGKEFIEPTTSLSNKPASRYVTFRFFTSSSMKLKKIPHFLAKNTTPRCPNSALYPMTEKTLNFPAVGILAMW